MCRPKKITIKDCRKIAKKFGGKCLSDICDGCRDRVVWKCKHGHIWDGTYSCVQMGSWCKKCSTNKTKGTLEELQKIAKSRGGQCLSDEYTTRKSKLLWKCSFGHTWHASPSDIKFKKSWCPHCAQNIMLTTNDCKNYAKSMGGCVVSGIYTGCKSKITWKCENGHIFNKTLQNAQKNWCCECKDKWFVTQGRLKNILIDVLKDACVIINYKGFWWLKLAGKNKKVMEIDIWFPKLQLAIEYDGEQHFRPICFGGVSLSRAKKNFRCIKKRDNVKNKKIAQHPKDVKYFIRFNYKEKSKLSKEYVMIKLKENGVPI